MADEILVTQTLSFTKSPAAAISIGETAKKFAVAGAKYVRGVQNVAISAEAIDLGDVGTPGWFFIKNIDITNFLEILSAVAGAVLLKLKPGEFACGRFGVSAPAAKADTAAVNMEYLIVED